MKKVQFMHVSCFNISQATAFSVNSFVA